ncbi:hypothetical protein DFH29DRAFT_872198 [Suillus ampliporus]|nr:hypothetical protein DFH29DRAFT_872198 [Suillus ampliporus]
MSSSAVREMVIARAVRWRKACFHPISLHARALFYARFPPQSPVVSQRSATGTNGGNNLQETITVEDPRGGKFERDWDRSRCEVAALYWFRYPAFAVNLTAVSSYAMDVGALTLFLWGFEERAKLMEFYERSTPHCLHLSPFSSRVDEIEDVVTGSRIWKQRIGMVIAKEPLDYSFTGVILRDSGIPWDLIFVHPYDKYDEARILLDSTLQLDRMAMVTIGGVTHHTTDDSPLKDARLQE